jgi:plastocyanin
MPTVAASVAAAYTAVTRKVQMVTIQELIGEFANIPDLKEETDNALKDGGPTQGKEVYAWNPNALTVYAGDAVDLTIGNAQGEEHIFVVPDLSVSKSMAGDSTAEVSFTPSKPGIYQFICAVPGHQPWMQGFLTVLPDSEAGG